MSTHRINITTYAPATVGAVSRLRLVSQAVTGPTGATGAAGTNGDWSTAQTLNAQTDSYQLQSSDIGKLVTLSKSTAVNLTVPSGLGLTAGQRIDLAQLGAGQVTVVASSTTVNGTPGLKLRAQYSAATLICTATNTYLLVGDLSA